MVDSPVHSDVESGYNSADSSKESLDEVYFTKPHLRYLNKQLQHLEPQGKFLALDVLTWNLQWLEILKWAMLSIPNLYQTTAFGLTGLVTIDMLSKLASKSSPVDLIFFDTLHHFQETLDLVNKVQVRYPSVKLHIFKPQGAETEEEFATIHGQKFWEVDEERYDYVAKVEPAQRAYAQLSVKAVLTGRRRSQGGKRGDLDIIEVDESGIIKINPLANWNFAQVQAYVRENDVPYNVLLDQGYKSVGDYHSTKPVKDGEDERSGRWQGREKTECGIHNSRSRYFQYMMDMKQKKEQEALHTKLVVETTTVIPSW